MPPVPRLRPWRSRATPASTRRSCRPRTIRLDLEQLPDRVLLSAGDSIANAIDLSFLNTSALYQTAHTTKYLANPGDVELFRISLNAGEVVTSSVNTAPYGGGLNSYLRIFQDVGGGAAREIASNDNRQGLDPSLTFQAPGTGSYYVGISSFDNTTYDPLIAGSGSGSSHGLFDLNLSKTVTATPPGLVGSAFQVSQSLAVWGDTVTIHYTIQNRNELASAPCTVSLLVSAGNRFNDGIPALQSAPVPTLAGGDTASGSFTIQLGNPGVPLAPFLDSQKIFLGLQIGSAGPNSPEQGNDWVGLQMLKAETDAASEGNTTRATAKPIALNSRVVSAALPVGDEDFFQIVLTEPGNLSALVDAGGIATSLTLYDAQGMPIVRSDGQSAANPDPLLTHGLTGSPDNGGTVYYLKVANLGATAGTYQLTTRFTPSVSNLQTVPVGHGANELVEGDFDGDGYLDLIKAGYGSNQVTVLLGNGDGTFREAGAFNVGAFIQTLVVGDFNGDGRLDLIAANSGNKGVRVLLGNGDGTFQKSLTVQVQGGNALATGDFNGDGVLDLAVANSLSNSVKILLGTGSNGSFQSPLIISVPGGANTLVARDFDEDGQLDLAVAGGAANQVTVLLNRGGLFQAAGTFDVGLDPDALTAADFNGDGHLDLATAEETSNQVTVLLGDGHGSFQTAGQYAVGIDPQAVVTGDFNGDGGVDLATANFFSNKVTVLLGQGNGAFLNAASIAVGANPAALIAGDFQGDGQVDLATVNYTSGDVSVLLGQGNGFFPPIVSPNDTGQQPNAIVKGDFNGDGRIDFAVTNQASDDVTLLLGQGNGTFQPVGDFAAGIKPKALVAGDFNGDGRLDLAVASAGYYSVSGSVTVLLGYGDGTFLDAGSYPVNGKASAIVAGDFNEDGNLDLAVTIRVTLDSSPSNVELLIGDGHGSFQQGGSFLTGDGPTALVEGDFDGDGHLDLAASNYYSGDVTVLLGDGQGNFNSDNISPPGISATALVVGDFNGDTHADLAVAYAGGIAILLNDGHGQFSEASTSALGTLISSLVTGDFDGDGHLDLAAANFLYNYYPTNTITVLLGDGQGSIKDTRSLSVGITPFALVAGDFNGDDLLDLAVTDYGSASVPVFLGTGRGTFLPPILAPSPVQSTPLLASFTGGTASDAVVLTATGQILFRQGLANQSGAFAPAVVINSDPQLAARDLALVQNSGSGVYLAALDARTFSVSPDPTVPRVPRVTLYQGHSNGTFSIVTSLDLPSGFLPANIASADLTGDGLGDLVITAATSDQVFVALQTAPGVFGPVTAYGVGVNPSAIALVKLSGDPLLDIVVTDRFSGQVSVLRNLGNGVFAAEERFRAGTGLYGLDSINGSEVVHSLEATSGVVAGLFDGTDLVVINSGTASFSLLSGDDHGGFLNPQPTLLSPIGVVPTAIAAGPFITGDNHLDLAILSSQSGTISIYRGDGQGGYTLIFATDAGKQPTGLAVGDVSRPGGGGPDGIPDLLVGDAYGDLLILTGNGDGTFSQYVRADQNVSLAVTSSLAPGNNTFFFSNQSDDQLAYATVAAETAIVANPTVYGDRSTGVQAPGPEAIVTVAGTQYLVVANSGGNNVLIYTLGPDGRPDLASKQTYFTGTDPVSLTITTSTDDLNNDQIPDVVVANAGSNDVSVFVGQLMGNTWTLAYRPRQSSGGLGPTSIAIADVTGADGTGAPDGNPDLLVSNGQTNQVSVLASRGNGFFINQSPATVLPLPTGSHPQEVFVGNFDGVGGLDLVTINTGSNDVTLIANFLTTRVISTVSSGGTFPVAAVVADFNDNGISDLIVANAGDGVIELLLGGSGGFEVGATLVNDAVAHITDLALVTVGRLLEVYGTDAGQAAAVLLLTFGADLLPVDFFPPNSSLFSGPSLNSVNFFLPPSPGFPSGLEFAAIVSVNLDTISTADLFLLDRGNIPDGGATQQIINGLTGVELTSLPSSLLESGSELGLQSAGRGTGDSDTQQYWGNEAGILLLNVIDSEDESQSQKLPGDEQNEAALGRELLREVNTKSQGQTHIGPMETPTWITPMLDRLWQEFAVKLQGATAEVLSSTGGEAGASLLSCQGMPQHTLTPTSLPPMASDQPGSQPIAGQEIAVFCAELFDFPWKEALATSAGMIGLFVSDKTREGIGRAPRKAD